MRPANHSCIEDLYVSHRIVEQSLWPPILDGCTCDVSGKRIENGAIQDGECFEFWRAFTMWKWTFEEKLITLMVYLKYILNSCVKRKCYFWVYMPFKLWLVTSLLCRHFKPNATSLEMEITWGVMKLSQSKPSRTTRNSVRELTFDSIPSGWRSKKYISENKGEGMVADSNFTMSDQKS